jgi:hypothetical protein
MDNEARDGQLIRRIYIDESSQTAHRYLVLGGIICGVNTAGVVEHLFAKLRLPELPAGELKWTKVSPSKLKAYMRVVDLFWSDLLSMIEFHSIVIDTSLRNDKAFNRGSREIGFNKEIYQLLMKFGRLHRDCVFHVFPDERATSSSTEELRLILNQGIRKNLGRADWPFRRVHFRSSHDEALLQLTDLLIGAIAFKLNGHGNVPGASVAKCEMCDYVLGKAGIRNVFKDTSVFGKFTVWHRQLRRVP